MCVYIFVCLHIFVCVSTYLCVCLHICTVSPSSIPHSLFFLISAIQKEIDGMRQVNEMEKKITAGFQKNRVFWIAFNWLWEEPNSVSFEPDNEPVVL